jgi:hypothetical protein
MGVTDNIAPLFDPGEPAVRFRQGTITAWNAATGSNTIDVAGGTLTDVPILNTGEAIALKAGHVVCLLGQGMSWFIIGRVTPPNDPSFAGASLAFASDTAQATNFALATTLATKASVALTVPAWADEAAVMAVGTCTLVNPRPAADFASCAVLIDGVSGPGVQQGFAINAAADNGDVQSLASSSSRVLVPGGATILCEMQIRSQAASWVAQATNIAGISAVAIFRSTT